VYAGVVSVLALDGPSLPDQIRTLMSLAGIGLGLALLLLQADSGRGAAWLGAAGHRRKFDLHSLAGAVIAAGAMVRLLTNGASLVTQTSAVIAALALFTGALLIALPRLLGMVRDLAVERAERARAQEFAEVAAHMHDSVLQTLTLIQRADPDEASRLARAQERELRAWLYERRKPMAGEPRQFSAAIKAVAAEVEDRHGVRVDVVTVGDADLDDALAACVAASREALVNAAKYAGRTPISVFAEVETQDGTDALERRRVEVCVRDRGPGFDLAAVGEDRIGVRESIIGRMRRHGGRAVIRTAPGAGTEVRVEMGNV
jgi:signal transduction histidine kinase